MHGLYRDGGDAVTQLERGLGAAPLAVVAYLKRGVDQDYETGDSGVSNVNGSRPKPGPQAANRRSVDRRNAEKMMR